MVRDAVGSSAFESERVLTLPRLVVDLLVNAFVADSDAEITQNDVVSADLDTVAA